MSTSTSSSFNRGSPSRQNSRSRPSSRSSNHSSNYSGTNSLVQNGHGSRPVSETDTMNGEAHRSCDKYGFFIEETDLEKQKQREIVTVSVEVILKREKKWLHMCDNWDKFMTKKWKKIRDRCRKGIPISVRGRAWTFLCAAYKQRIRYPELYAQLNEQIGDEKINDEIRKDLNRQFPSHEMFAENNGFGQQDLYGVLKAFSIVKPDIGYCQGQAPLASVLLMHMPAEDAFWSLVQICDHFIPGYFSPGLEAIQIHGAVLNGFLKRFYPPIYKLMKKQNIDPVLYMTEWFMCIFSRTLPWPTVLRVWDMFFCEGIVVVFKVALILMACALGDSSQRKQCPTMYETLHSLRNIPQKCMSEEFLIEKVIDFELSIRDLEREQHLQILKRKKQKEALLKEQRKRNASK